LPRNFLDRSTLRDGWNFPLALNFPPALARVPCPAALRAPAARRDPAHADGSPKGRRHEGKSAGAPHQHGATASRLSIACLNFRCLARGGILRGGGTGRSTGP